MEQLRPEGVGPGYQWDTKYAADRPPLECAWAEPTAMFKRHADAIAEIALPEPQRAGGEGLWGGIAARRSRRKFRDAPMPLEVLSQLLWATQGVTGEEQGYRFRACGSAGALYPNETYLVLNRVEGAGPGIAHYNVLEHSLSLLVEGEFGTACAEACLGQRFCATAQVVFAWDAVVSRSAQKYGDRCYRYLYLDAGHIGGQLQLAAVALGLGSVNIGAFLDDEVNALFGLDGLRETVVYLTAVGAL
jgi:SagB-type dehydrogenase family enzyme